MIYGKSSFGQRVISGGHRERPGTTGGAPGVHRVGPPIPVGPLGRKGKCPALMGWRTTRGPPPHAPRVETLGGRGRPTCLGGQEHPPGRRPPCRLDLQGLAHPLAPYIYVGGRGQPHPCPGASPPPVTPPYSQRRAPGEALLRSPMHPSSRRRAAGSLTTSPPPLLDQEGGDVAAPDVC